jgi:hypothetical protein
LHNFNSLQDFLKTARAHCEAAGVIGQQLNLKSRRRFLPGISVAATSIVISAYAGRLAAQILNQVWAAA